MEAATQPTATETPAEAPEPATAPENAAQGTTVPDAATAENGERDEGGKFLSREAASYRRRLRDAEGERDQLRERLERYERTEVERIASGAGLAAPADVWTFGASLDTLRGEDGSIDAEAGSGLVGEIVKDRPGLQAPKLGDLGIGRGATAAGTARAPEVGLSALLKPERR
ncbi:MAG TPA: hypothetical protein VHY83_04210 [Solirubrobacteraceae bacterium]|jgi:hypothetical protein|nr:hypothetical protein [Solirubrobacteraceae bacterium]